MNAVSISQVCIHTDIPFYENIKEFYYSEIKHDVTSGRATFSHFEVLTMQGHGKKSLLLNTGSACVYGMFS